MTHFLRPAARRQAGRLGRMASTAGLALLVLAACGTAPGDAPAPQAHALEVRSEPVEAPPTPPAGAPEESPPPRPAESAAQPPGWRAGESPLRYVAVRASKSNLNGMATVYTVPGAGAILGEAMPGARLPVFEEAPAKGSCKGGWLRVQYGGWVCADITQEAPSGEETEQHAENRNPTQDAVTTEDAPLHESPWAPASGTKKKGSKVKVSRIVESDGAAYAQIGASAYVPAELLSYKGRRTWSTPFSGVAFGDHSAPPYAFFIHEEVPIFAEPGLTKPKDAIGKKKRYEQAPVLELKEQDGQRFARIQEGWFPIREGVAVAEPDPRPAELPADARWVLVDLSEQLLEAYEGDRMVFSTLVSSGARAKTITGTFPLTRKFRYRTMAGEMFGKPYRVDSVPWAQYFQGAYALHGAFWHDKFGRRASHGCVNLAPADARWMAQFLEPVLPAGWWSIFPPDAGLPTSTVIVRD